MVYLSEALDSRRKWRTMGVLSVLSSCFQPLYLSGRGMAVDWALYRTPLALPIFHLFYQSGSSWAYLVSSCLPLVLFLVFFCWSVSLDRWSPGQSVQVDKAFCPIHTQRVIHCLFTHWNARVEAIQDAIQNRIPSVVLGWLLRVDETILYWNCKCSQWATVFIVTHTYLASSPKKLTNISVFFPAKKFCILCEFICSRTVSSSCWLVKRERDV